MKNAILILFLLFSGLAHSQDKDCSRFKNGTFMIVDEKYGNSYITREGDTQIESGDISGLEMVFDVIWKDECTYTLEIREVTKNPQNLPVMPEMILNVEIIEVKDNSYIQQSSTNISDMVLESEMFLIEK